MSAGGPAPARPADSEQPPGNLAAVIEALLLVAEEPPTIAVRLTGLEADDGTDAPALIGEVIG